MEGSLDMLDNLFKKQEIFYSFGKVYPNIKRVRIGSE
jgi:hypothetical protein